MRFPFKTNGRHLAWNGELIREIVEDLLVKYLIEISIYIICLDGELSSEGYEFHLGPSEKDTLEEWLRSSGFIQTGAGNSWRRPGNLSVKFNGKQLESGREGLRVTAKIWSLVELGAISMEDKEGCYFRQS